ncbi:EthD domain-containing protein [Croceicoccus hydrothermalis]|uniref:EthD domain-containing protein n=1 Tax=Croceicoccus hydrothermalis TaxID=2867964 RepID=UPI001EFBD695|nr:EthD domain-containing protein [Croceicoccus hydrothermalis]
MTTHLPDFSARDETIRHLTYTPLTRRPGVPRDLFDAYWRDVHGPLCARLPGLGYYVQHHFDAARSADLWPMPDGVEPLTIDLDGMVEIGFPDRESQQRFEDASPLLFADERNFIGHDVAYDLPDGSRTLIDRDPDPVPNRKEPGHHLHLHVHGHGEAFEATITNLAEALASAEGIRKVRLHLPEPYDNSEPQPAAPGVDHRLPPRRKHVALLEVAWGSRIDAERWMASEDYATHAYALGQQAKAMGGWLVEGVYTYIRDGALTTAGVRGSRPAMLIERAGALNQVQDEVTRLFDGR